MRKLALAWLPFGELVLERHETATGRQRERGAGGKINHTVAARAEACGAPLCVGACVPVCVWSRPWLFARRGHVGDALARRWKWRGGGTGAVVQWAGKGEWKEDRVEKGSWEGDERR